MKTKDNIKLNNNLLIAVRWIVGLLFIFSGLIKANDPLGLSYKMQEFFEAWNWPGLADYTLTLAFIMNVFEVLAGVAIIIGWRIKLFSWLLLLLIIFFTFLTGYAVLSGKIKTCGCFGDCLPLTPLQSFIKDIVLLMLIVLLFVSRNYIRTIMSSVVAITLLLFTVAAVSLLQAYVLKHLPLIDCLPYKAGNNLLQQMKPPVNALQDSIVMTFKYKKNNKIFEFTPEQLPEDLDSTYEFIDRYDKIVRHGNAIAPISDFALQTIYGNDTTNAILSQEIYVMLFAKDFSTINSWKNKDFISFQNELKARKIPVYIVTADIQNALRIFSDNTKISILLGDATIIKTAARVNPTLFIMQQANVKAKYSYADMDKAINYIRLIH